MLCPYGLHHVDSFEKVVDPRHGAISYVCPRCPPDARHEIPLRYVTADERIPRVLFSLVGKTGHGKTCFLGSLIGCLHGATSAWPNFSYLPLDEVEFAKLRGILDGLNAGTLPPGTNPNQRLPPLLLELESLPLVGSCQLMVYDVGGAVFNQVATVHEIATFVVHSSAVVWLLSLSNLDAALDLDEFLNVYLNSLRRLECDPAKQSLILALTQGDRLLTRDDLPESVQHALSSDIDPSIEGWSSMQELSKDIESWLETSLGYGNFVRRVRREFRHVRYCINSALGSSPSDGNQMQWSIQPRGVLLPLWWVLHDTFPQVKVTTNEGRERVFFSLDAAVSEANRNTLVDQIILEAGEYRLQRPLKFRRPIRVVGKGREVTRLICDQQEFVAIADLSGTAPLKIEQLAFEHEGQLPAHAFLVRSGSVTFAGCRFVGAKRDASREIGGAGLRIHGNSVAKISDCVATKNDLYGLWADNGSQVQFGKCETHQNGRSGICVSGMSKTKLVACHANQNGHFGVELRGNSDSTITDCKCQTNGNAGIAYLDHAEGEAISNQCRENGNEGIRVHDTAYADLKMNRCDHNRECGIRFGADCGGTAADNFCDDNGVYGIEVGGEARPVIVSGECRRNGKIGLLVKRGRFSLFRAARISNWQCHDNGVYEFVDERDAWSRYFFGNTVSKIPSGNGRGGS